MKHSKILIAAGLAMLMTACNNDSGSDFTPDIPYTKSLELTRAESEVNASLNDVAFDIAKLALNPTEENKNVAVSPLSVELALAMVVNSVDDASAVDFIHSLRFSDVATLNSTCNKLMRYLSNPDGNSRFLIANSVWINDLYPSVASVWQTELEQKYYAEIQKLNFTVPENVNIINKWSSDKTHGTIPSILDEIKESMAAYFINALYFSGDWGSPFNKKNTEVKSFHADAGDVTVPFMYKSENIWYSENEDMQVVKLPLRGHTDAYFILPEQNSSVTEVIEILNQDVWSKITSQMSSELITLLLPKFKSEFTQDLGPILDGLGIPKEVILSGMGIDEAVSLKGVHKIYTEIDETGAKVAAATVVGSETTWSPGVIMNFNRPFVYLFQNRDTGTIFAMGCINNPSSN